MFSKALANGYPLAVVAGKAEVFERPCEAWISGTYHGWPPAIAAALATLSVLEQEPVVEHVWTLGTPIDRRIQRRSWLAAGWRRG